MRIKTRQLDSNLLDEDFSEYYGETGLRRKIIPDILHGSESADYLCGECQDFMLGEAPDAEWMN